MLCFPDPGPDEVVRHFTGDAHQQARIGPLKQVEDDLPLVLLFLPGFYLFLEDLPELLVKDIEPELLGNGVDEPALFF